MKLLLLALLVLALWAPPGWAARKKPKSPTQGLSPPSSPAALKVPAQPAKSQHQLTASELIPGKGVAVEETTKSAAGAGSVTAEKEFHRKGRTFSVQKNSILRRKEPAVRHLDSQSLGKGVVVKKEELAQAGKKVLGTKKNEANSTTARTEVTGSNTNIGLSHAGGLSHHTKEIPVKGEVASHRTKTRKEYVAVTHRNATHSQKGKVSSSWHRNESQERSSSAPKNVPLKNKKEPKFLPRNATRTLLPKKNLFSSGKDHHTHHRNNSHTLMQKKPNNTSRNITQAQEAKEARFLHKNVSRDLPGKDSGTLFTNISGTSPELKQAIFQRNTSRAQSYKKSIVPHRNASQVLPEKKSGTVHRNMSWVQARKAPIPSQKNASWVVPQERLRPSLRNASQALPRNRHSTHQRNITWTEVRKESRHPHKNASWDLLKKEPIASQRNLSQELGRTKHGARHRIHGHTGARNVSSAPLRTTSRTETVVKEHGPSHRKGIRVGTVTPRWRLTVPTGRGEPIMPSLPMTCLLSEHAIACGNARLKHVPKLNDSVLKTLYLAENEITNIPGGIFLGLPNLEWLDLSKNKLDSAGLHPEAFKNLTKLKRLNLDGNQLTTVPALPSSLQELKMNDNHLEGLQRHNFRGLFKLLTLELEGNQLHDGNVLPTAFKPLGRLIYLRLDRNRFRAIPSGLPASLQELHLDSNRIEEVTESVLNKTLNLTVLVLSNNKLQEDRIAPRAWIDLPKLEALDLSHNRLAHVPSFLPRHLKQLTLHHNCIERIPGYVFAHMKPGLEFLHLSHNVLQDDGIHAVSFLGLYRSLAELLLDNNQLQSIPRGILNLKGLQVLRLSHNRIRNIPLNSVCDTRVAEDSNIVSMHLENNLIDRRRIPPTAFSCIKAYHSVVLRPQENEEEDY
ncbi:extracellular matrix protein 2-like [Sceloporus undulatus]|uniref:extracellular matrix protein 2-like n=1 Tax=Sceloporus undulatus TaxID=8520 RepID=UPI001C4C0440|nr:extracellular matrix protein 2-like [Sceloporus undulatus]